MSLSRIVIRLKLIHVLANAYRCHIHCHCWPWADSNRQCPTELQWEGWTPVACYTHSVLPGYHWTDPEGETSVLPSSLLFSLCWSSRLPWTMLSQGCWDTRMLTSAVHSPRLASEVCLDRVNYTVIKSVDYTGTKCVDYTVTERLTAF